MSEDISKIIEDVEAKPCRLEFVSASVGPMTVRARMKLNGRAIDIEDTSYGESCEESQSRMSEMAQTLVSATVAAPALVAEVKRLREVLRFESQTKNLYADHLWSIKDMVGDSHHVLDGPGIVEAVRSLFAALAATKAESERMRYELGIYIGRLQERVDEAEDATDELRGFVPACAVKEIIDDIAAALAPSASAVSEAKEPDHDA